ncbi:MAG: PAS domain S-box protein [Acidobacteriaceae bacterium]|nr:PAS domain S-box protein [Acidobacteriaceae bacterium]
MKATMARRRDRAIILLGTVLVCCTCAPGSPLQGQGPSTPDDIHYTDGHVGPVPLKYLTFTHLTANDGLSQSHVNTILQDRRGFMWFATHDGLNRYDGNTFVLYKNNPSDPASLGGNFITDMLEDDQGFLWIVTQTGGMSKFDPKTERFTVYRHEPGNPNSIADGAITSIARDAHGCLWLGTEVSGLDRFDPFDGKFTHYLNDNSGKFLDRISSVTVGRQGDIWFVGNRGLFHLDPQKGEITHPPGTLNGLGADYVLEDSAGNLWMLAWSPAAGLVKYGRRARQYHEYPIGRGAHGMINSKLLDDHGKGFWVPSSLGLYYFDRQTERFSYRFQHDETDPDSLSDNGVNVAYQDRGGLLWVGTATGGVNLLNPAQERFGTYRHHSHDKNSLLARTVYAIYGEPDGVLWIGYWPRALDRFDLKTGRVTHYVPGPKGTNSLGGGEDVNSIYKDGRGYLWVGGWGGGLVRFDEHTGQFKRFGGSPGDAKSLNAGHITSIFGDRNGDLWVGSGDGAARINTTTGQSTDFWPEGIDRTEYGKGIWGIYPDRSGTMWFVTRPGQIIPVEQTPKSPASPFDPSGRPLRPTNYFVLDVHEDRAGTLWVAAWDGLYRFNRQNQTFTRYTEAQGLPSSSLGGILEDKDGRLWISTNKGISRFDPQTGKFRSYDASDGLQADEFSRTRFQAADGEMFFGGIHGINAFYPENIRDNPYVPPVVLTSFRILNKPVTIGPKSELNNAISYTDSLTLSYRDKVFSFEFASLSYANSHKNRYRYKLEPFQHEWTEVGSTQRLSTYTNLDPGKYVFRVQGSNSDGVWNEQGVALRIRILPPWWGTWWFRALCAAAFLALLWALYRLRIHEVQEREKKFREAVETMPAMAFIALPDGSRRFINKRWLEYTGLSPEQASGLGWQTAAHPDDLARVLEKWRLCLASGEPLEYEARLRRADGQYRWFLVRAVPVRDEKGNILKWCAAATDIEDRKRAEQLQADLAHINRVSLMGEMAASLAHEIKQPIAGAITSANSCRLWLAHDPPNLDKALAAVDRIERDGSRAASIIDRLRSLYKKAPPQRELVAVNEVIAEMAVLLRGEAARHGLSIRTDLADERPTVKADRVQIQQVLMNLMLNGIEAMKDTGGVLSVSSELGNDGQVLISVTDTGVGLPPEKADEIFKAFFTTKPQGSGMGLAISRSIVESHGGRLWATANDGPGATFIFTLPVAAKGVYASARETQSGIPDDIAD